MNNKNVLISTLMLMSSSMAFAQQIPKIYDNPTRSSVQNVAPALLGYNMKYIHSGLWERTELSKRDRSLITIASLISRNEIVELPMYIEIALDNQVTPSEISEIVTHLAFYAGRSSAISAAISIEPVFIKRGILADSLPNYDVKRLPIDEKAEAQRASQVAANFSETSPSVVQFTTDVLFKDLWLRPDLKPRDRSLITVSSLVASGNFNHIPYHLNRAMDNGFTQSQASEMLSQLAFYAGWPNTYSAMPFFKQVFESRKTNSDTQTTGD